jgi:two-component system, OmpR family, sensor kinase
MFKSLYSKLAAVLTVLFLLVGLSFIIVTLFSTEMYQQEVNQKLNSQLADHIVKEKLLMNNQQVNEGALKEIFHMLMVINPSIEIYLLDPQGKILAFSAPPGKVKRRQVSLTPIKDWLAGDATMPIVGDDPRNADGEKVFTAARIPEKGELQGYLYVILGGEAYESATQKLRGSYILKLSTWMIGTSILFAILAGLVLFASLTGRLKRLAMVMDTFKKSDRLSQIALPVNSSDDSSDEIGRLGAAFKDMAERIEQQMEKLVNSDTMRRDLIANISHDLRTPLATLQGYIETLLLKDESLADEERRNYLEIAIKHCEQLNTLVDKLLELAKLDSVEMKVLQEPFELSELVQDIVQKFQLMAGKKGIRITANIGQKIPFVKADIGLIERALVNLIENAIHYTPDGGEVKLALIPQGQTINVTVSDTGYGIPEDELPHIFNRFYQLDKSRKSDRSHSGLGLAITERILELHGRSIKVTSVVNSGTSFSFQLPIHPD